MVEVVELVVHETSSMLELALHLFHISRLFFDDSLHLLSQLFLKYLLALIKLLFDLFGSSLMFLEALLTVELGLPHSIVHAVDFSLLFLDGSLELDDVLLEAFNILVELVYFGVELC